MSDLAGCVLGIQCPPKPWLKASKLAECVLSRLPCFASPLRAVTHVSDRRVGFEFGSQHLLVLRTVVGEC